MRARLRRLSSLLRIEFGVSWRFPILEGLAAILFFGFLLNTTRFGFHEDFSTGNAQQIPNFLDGLAPHYLYNGMMSFNSLVLLAPILVAIAVARPFEDGFYRTHLTLPVKRLTLLVTKAGLVILILATLLSFAIMTTVTLIFPLLPTAADLFLVIVATWLFIALQVSISTLIAVQTRKLTTTVIGGIGFWSMVMLLLGLEGVPSLVIVILNPMTAAIEFITQGLRAPVIEDLQIGLVISLMIVVV
ncbi:MAG: hypothetical protein ACTSYJ_04760, partial [Candidatus Thorarchaeota archaeon]